MSSSDRTTRRALLLGLGAFALGGCTFRPLHASRDVVGDGVIVGEQLGSVDVAPILSRSGVNLRNELLFRFTGGGEDVANPRYRLVIQLVETATGVIVETISGRPSGQNAVLTASYRLVDIATGRELHRGSVVARASFDSGVQRFANQRAERDAQDRAVRTLADLMRNDLAAFFVASRPA